MVQQMSRPLKTLILGLFALILAQPAHAMTLGQIAQVAQTATPAAFNTVEFSVPTMQDKVPQWNRVSAAINRDNVKLQACLDNAANCTGQAMAAWRTLVTGLRNQDQATKLNLVNAFFNSWQYRSDQEAYGVQDYWASPLEFMANSGDCEDYAIAKYDTLKFLGFDDSQMRIVALVDHNRGGIGHAILSVTTNDGKQILDNLSNYVYTDNQQTGYEPRFAVNQTGIYTYAQQPQVVLASIQY
jgi:predicted transglutaminase-like cysteine proteinase